MLRLYGPLLAANGVLAEGEVTLEGGQIAAVHPGPPRATPDITIEGVLLPGFIDLQINGAFGHDFMGEPESVIEVAARLPATGVTGFLPTIVAAPLDHYRPWLERITAASRETHGAQVLGLHLEGPFLNEARKATNRPELLRQPNVDELHTMLNGFVRLMTLAPELPGALELVAELRRNGVVASAGHSDATYEQAMAGFAAGIAYGTHLFNAMRGMHHREPGLVGALLASQVPVGLIVDGIHAHPEMIRLAYRLKGSAGITLVTDTIAALGMAPGTYQLGTQRVTTDGVSARLADGVTLAGAVLSMDAAIRNMRAITGCSLAEAAAMASTTPARVLGLPRKGQIAPGFDADLTVMDEQGRITLTIVGGEIVYRRAEATPE